MENGKLRQNIWFVLFNLNFLQSLFFSYVEEKKWKDEVLKKTDYLLKLIKELIMPLFLMKYESSMIHKLVYINSLDNIL